MTRSRAPSRRSPAFRRRAGVLLAAAALLGAAGYSTDNRIFAVPGGSGAWLPPGPELVGAPLEPARPEATLVLLYLPGSETEGRADPCVPRRDADSTTPDILHDLAGAEIAGKRLAVFAMCTRTKVGQFSNDGRGTPKIRGRVADLRAALDALRGYGVPPAQIFLAGHSAGGWAALAVEAADPDGQNAAIALMPAFAGERTGRTEAWTALRAELAEEIAGMPAARALVYASEGDPFERPQDLAFLSAMPEVALVALAPGEVEGVPCARPDPHRLAFLDCFATQRDEILAFLAANLSR